MKMGKENPSGIVFPTHLAKLKERTQAMWHAIITTAGGKT
jgi:hypothetical protein